MKVKSVILLTLFMGIGAVTFAQTQSAAPADKKDAPAQTIQVDQQKTTGCPHHQAAMKSESKADCKWVDANNDGVCDTCGKKDCSPKAKSGEGKNCDPATCCPGHKADAKPSGCCPSKDGKK